MEGKERKGEGGGGRRGGGMEWEVKRRGKMGR
jgi:hypothetical protein